MNKLTKYKKNKISKTHKIIISFILIILTIGIGYSALLSNLSISGNLLVKKYEDPQRKCIGIPDTPYSLMEGEGGCLTMYYDLIKIILKIFTVILWFIFKFTGNLLIG